MTSPNASMKRGFTLVELLVTIAIFSVVVTIATAGFVNSLRTQRQVASLISTQSNASLVLEQMARQIRTGFLFCHDRGVNNALNGGCNNLPYTQSGDPGYVQGCTAIDSGYADPSAPDAGLGLQNPSDLPIFSCPSLDYYDAQGDHVNYSLQNNALVESVNSSTPASLTGDSVKVTSLHFLIFGNMEGDSWAPRVTVTIGVVPSSTDPAVMGSVLNLETTVSARTIDCTSGGQC